MAKEFVINTSRVNSYGTRVLTEGIDLSQFERNPLLLYMHKRGWENDSTPIGRVENLRTDGDKLIGTPVFDLEDDFAAKIARKWDNGFLRMCSAGVEPTEYSSDPKLVLMGQNRATVAKSKLIEVSIVDIGSNDDALQLYHDGKVLKLAVGEQNDLLPLLESETNQTNFSMNKILLALGLAATATEDEAVNAITQLQAEAKKVETIELARIEGAINAAIETKRITADKKEHFVKLGKSAGFESLETTLAMLSPAVKPNDLLNLSNGGNSNALPADARFSQLPEETLEALRTNNRAEYVRLYKKEFGFEPKID